MLARYESEEPFPPVQHWYVPDVDMRTLVLINRILYHGVRYLLDTIMLYYAIVKLVNVQFQVSPFTYTRPLD